MDLAKERLEVLKICNCEEYDELKELIDKKLKMHIVEVFGRTLLSTLFLVEGVRKIFLSRRKLLCIWKDYGVPEILFFSIS